MPRIEDIFKPDIKNEGKPSLVETHPEIADEWLYEKNCGWKPEDFSRGSAVDAWWQCSQGHEWQARISNRTNRNSTCPKCSNVDLSDYPEALKHFDHKKNKGIDPTCVTFRTKIHWQCKKGKDHLWCRPFIKNMAKIFCPFCNNRKVSKTNCLSTLYPKLAKEFHKTKNGKLTPGTILATTSKKVWWRCGKCRHEWQAAVILRSSHNRGCPKCWEKRRVVFYHERAAQLRELRHKEESN